MYERYLTSYYMKGSRNNNILTAILQDDDTLSGTDSSLADHELPTG